MDRLRQRADFLAAAKGLRASANGFVLQARQRGDDGPARFGFTASRKVGNAVERNRLRRRLRDMVRRTDADEMAVGHDYVVVARRAAINLPFDRLMDDFKGALRRVRAARGKKARFDGAAPQPVSSRRDETTGASRPPGPRKGE
jgi:ribonuclease P protein component